MKFQTDFSVKAKFYLMKSAVWEKVVHSVQLHKPGKEAGVHETAAAIS